MSTFSPIQNLSRGQSNGQKRRHRHARVALVTAILLLPCVGEAINLAPLGTGILGYQAAVDSSPGTPLFHAGGASAINDQDTTTHVDNFSGGSDGGQGVSFVGITWRSTRYEQISTLTLTLAAFGDGGWFGPNNMGPGVGGALTPDYLTEPTVQVSTNHGASWFAVPATSDYLTSLNGATIGGGQNPNPTPLTAMFTLSPPVTNVNGIRIIGSNGGTADGNGFIGVFELDVQANLIDTDNDGMPDGWEQAHGLIVGVDDSSLDPDADGLTNLQEYLAGTDPHNPDTDGDGYSDGTEVAQGSDPNDPNSIPGNLARQGNAILGTESSTGFDSLFANAGVFANINDGDLTSRADTWNNTGTDPLSFVGILWDQPQTNPILRLELTLATFLDGGWFGPNNKSPGVGGVLTPAYLTDPNIQVTTDGGTTWSNVVRTSDYLTVMNGHGIGGGTNPNPTSATATFILNPPIPDVNGVRIIGSEGGVASRGFLGVFELKVYARTDSDHDGMDDDWERKHGLIVGVNDAALDPDGDGLSNLQEFQLGTDPQKADTDGDGLNDGAEVNTYHTNPTSADTDGDGLNDGDEINLYHTNPLVADTDGDGFPDGMEVSFGSDPNNAGSIPANLARRDDAGGVLGTEDTWGGTDTPVANAGSTANINDGDLTTRVDSWNGTSLDTLSYVGIVWTNTVTNAIVQLRLSLATFFDGGWFGPNNGGPGAGGTLSSNVDLLEPIVQASADAGITWTNVAFSSDYMAALDGHPLPAIAFGPPTLATANFSLNPPLSGINGIRIIGSEGGQATGGFLGVFELEVLAHAPQAVRLENPAFSAGHFTFEFASQPGVSYLVQFKNALTESAWQTFTTISGDGTRKQVSDNPPGPQRFYRVSSQ